MTWLAFADADADGVVGMYATARDGVLRSLDARNGETEWTTALTDGDVQMTPPSSLGDLDGDGSPELVAVTNDGIVRVVDPGTGEIRATYERDASVYTHVTLADLDADGKAGGVRPIRGRTGGRAELRVAGLPIDLDVLVEFVEVDLLVSSLERQFYLAPATTPVLLMALPHPATLRVGHCMRYVVTRRYILVGCPRPNGTTEPLSTTRATRLEAP